MDKTLNYNGASTSEKASAYEKTLTYEKEKSSNHEKALTYEKTSNYGSSPILGEGKVFVNLFWDSGFKAVFADPNNKELLIELLNILLPEYVRVKDITKYRDREKRPDFDGAKKTILDLSCEGEDGSVFNVEVQRVVGEFFFERIYYYAAGDYHSQLLKGDKYCTLKPVYEIVFLSGKLWHESLAESLERPVSHHIETAVRYDGSGDAHTDLLPEKIVTRYVMKEVDSNIFAPSSIFCIFAELGRFHKTLSECKTKEDFTFYWFLNGWKEARIPEMFAGIPFCEKIAKACEVAAFSEDKYNDYQENMRSERDIAYFNSVCFDEGLEQGQKLGLEKGQKLWREQGRQEGLEQGREEGQKLGRQQEKIDLAKKMKESGISFTQIAAITGLSETDISML